MGRQVLVVEDDPTVAEVIATYLHAADFAVRHTTTGEQALLEVADDAPDLVVLDLLLPGIDGLQVCRRIRAADPQLPVIMLTALGEEDDRLAGLEIGADDYVTKPFSPRELVLRVESVLRRAGAAPAEVASVVDGPLAIDAAAHRVTLSGSELALTVREFDLLLHLVRHPGQALTRADLLQQVWGWTFGDESTVTVHVRRLREKIEVDPARPERLATVWGVGYRWEPWPA
ncbi:MAG: response regulator transcription factor [Nocardioidaceae bacterium]